MASAFSHAIAAIAIGKAALSLSDSELSARIEKQPWKFYSLMAFCGALPDIDAIGYWAGVPYDSLWGHRGFTHSFFFALILAALVTLLFYRSEKTFGKAWWTILLMFFLATASHPFLDAFTTGGLGVAFFAPFYDERYFFPWRVIKVSPISITRFFSSKGVKVLQSEFIWVWIPSIVVMLVAHVLNPKARQAN